MANQGYLYDDARDLFYLKSGVQSTEGGSLEGELTTVEAVTKLLGTAENKVVMLLFPFWKKGMIPYLSNLQGQKSWNQVAGGSVTQFQLPPTDTDANIFYQPIAGWIVRTDAGVGVLPNTISRVELVFKTAEISDDIRWNVYAYPGTGVYLDDYVPVYFEGGYMKFLRAPKATDSVGVDNIFLKYFRMSKAVSSGASAYSDLNAALMPLTVYFMLTDFFGIDGSSLDLALHDVNAQHASELLQIAVGNLGFNPFKSGE